MNKPAGQAKQRPQRRPPRKPYIERDDGNNFERFAAITTHILSLPAETAAEIRRVSRDRPKRKRQAAH